MYDCSSPAWYPYPLKYITYENENKQCNIHVEYCSSKKKSDYFFTAIYINGFLENYGRTLRQHYDGHNYLFPTAHLMSLNDSGGI